MNGRVWGCIAVLLLVWGMRPPPLLQAPPIVVSPDTVAIRYAAQYHTTYTIAHVLLTKATKYNIPHQLAFRVAQTESRFNPQAVSSSGAIGLVQVLPSTAFAMDSTSTRGMLFDPEYNTEMGFRFLRQMRRRYDGNWWKALVAYNQGPGYMDTMTATTHPYADKVLYAR